MYDYKSGLEDKIEYLDLGYWWWSTSIAFALAAALVRLSQKKPGFHEEYS